MTGYDSGGNAITVKDPLGNVTTTQYDALNRATTVTDARTGQTAFTFDAAGRRTVVADPNANRTTFAYDAADRLTTLTTPIGTTTYVYDNANELTDRTDADGRRVTFAYDSGGRQTNECWLTSSGGTVRTVTSTYDSAGQLTAITDPDATLTFTYDSGGNQHTAETSGGAGQPDVTLTSSYNQTHDRLSVADNLSSPMTVSFTYDNAHRLTSITQSVNNLVVNYGYDAANNVTSISRPYSNMGSTQYVNTTLSYDAANRLTTLTHGSSVVGSGGGGVTPIATYVYGYDNANRLTSEQNAEGTVTYSYDNANQLTGASGSRAETYTYDSGGNRTMTSYTTGSDNELTVSPGATYAYDAEGNMTGKTLTATGNNWAFTYDYRNRLTVATEKNSGGSVISQSTYTYDALNRRIGTQVDDDGAGPHAPVQTWMVYDGLNPYADFSVGSGGGAVLQTRYLYGPAVDDLLARTDSGGTTAWYLKDRLGTVRDIVNTSGTVLDHLSYDSYGKVLSESNAANGDRFKFAGMQYDTSTVLYFDNARYYDPASGRFVRIDPKGFAAGDANLYRYVSNAPTLGLDTTGTNADGASGGMYGGLIGGASGSMIVVLLTSVLVSPVGWPLAIGAVVVGTGVGTITGYGVGSYFADDVDTGFMYGYVAGAIFGSLTAYAYIVITPFLFPPPPPPPPPPTYPSGSPPGLPPRMPVTPPLIPSPLTPTTNIPSGGGGPYTPPPSFNPSGGGVQDSSPDRYWIDPLLDPINEWLKWANGDTSPSGGGR